VAHVADAAVPDHHVGLASENRRDQARDLLAGVLVVGVGVDDDVGAETQAGVEPGHEAVREPLPAREAHDVIGTVLARHLRGAVRGAVVDDEHLDPLDSGHLARDPRERLGERRLLVEARDLDDQLHRGQGGDRPRGTVAQRAAAPLAASRRRQATDGGVSDDDGISCRRRRSTAPRHPE
jgi:hypothetical protein